MRVYVYRNLQRGCISVRCVRTKKVIAHLERICIAHAKFKVSTAGRNRVLKEMQKNVHAGVEGEWVECGEENHHRPKTRVTYDPYKYDTFVDASTGTPILTCDLALVTTCGVYIL